MKETTLSHDCEHEHHGHDCDCGHDHAHHEHDCERHEHEHGCGCGHDHAHHEHDCEHHEHEHDCGCGHDHAHHGHDCEHHEHEHGHEHHSHDHSRGTHVFILENLGCAHCAAKMEDKIRELPGISDVTITYATKQLRFSADHPQRLLPEIQRICASIESQVVVREEETESEGDDKKEPFLIAAGALLFAAGIILDHMGFKEPVYLCVFIAAYLILGGEILLEAARNIAHGQVFDENFLMSIATLGAFGLRAFGAQEYAEAVGVMLFYRIGEFFEHRAVERSRGQIMEAVDLRPEVVHLLRGEDVQTIPAADAAVGDLLLIRPGDRIPLDGVIAAGESRLDTSPITGEPVPVAVRAGDRVTSGCVNTSGQLKLTVEKPLSESMVSRILDSVENAAASKPKIDRFITRFSRIYTPCVVLVALCVAILPPLFTGNWRYWIYTALTFLVMSCPCALVLSVPLAFFSGIGAGSRKGILFKGGVSIESLARIRTVVLDKTGTVTEGNFRLQKIIPAGALPESELLRICAGCEQNSTHPIAQSIVDAARERCLTLDTPQKLEELSGLGVAAELPAGQVLCGNRKLLTQYGVAIPESVQAGHGAEVLIAIGGAFAGYMVISDTVKPDAGSAIARLKAMGLHTVMLTGDAPDSAQAVAHETGIDEVCAKLLPQQKLDALERIRREHGAAMFVGDGINDAPVLAGADVGAAMGTGADAAIEAADAVFMNSNVTAIPDAVAIARGTNRIALQNVVFALIIKITVMILGLLGFANMWMAVFADTGVAMLCVLNSIRVLYRKNLTKRAFSAKI